MVAKSMADILLPFSCWASVFKKLNFILGNSWRIKSGNNVSQIKASGKKYRGAWECAVNKTELMIMVVMSRVRKNGEGMAGDNFFLCTMRMKAKSMLRIAMGQTSSTAQKGW